MSSYTLLLVIAAVAGGALVASKPHLSPRLRTVELAEAMNKTVCPIQVVVDEDPQRIPRRIKLMKCAPHPNKWCIEQHIPQHECCAHNHNGHVMECVEIHDTVLVKYLDKGTTRTYDVAVGCTCMIEQSNSAVTPPP